MSVVMLLMQRIFDDEVAQIIIDQLETDVNEW